MTTAFAPMSAAETSFFRNMTARIDGMIAEAKALAIVECVSAGEPLPCPERWADSYYHRQGWASGIEAAGDVVTARWTTATDGEEWEEAVGRYFGNQD